MELIIMLVKSLSHIMDASKEDLAQCPVIRDSVFCHFELVAHKGAQILLV